MRVYVTDFNLLLASALVCSSVVVDLLLSKLVWDLGSLPVSRSTATSYFESSETRPFRDTSLTRAAEDKSSLSRVVSTVGSTGFAVMFYDIVP